MLLFFTEAAMSLAALIKNAAGTLGLDACGICVRDDGQELLRRLADAGPIPFAPPAEKRLSWDAVLPGALSAVVCLFPYKPDQREQGNIALYARPIDYHRINRQYLSRLSDVILSMAPGAQCAAITDTSPLTDRWLAWQAGLGFFGKNHCLIHPKYGSFFTIGALLTTIPLAPDRPMASRCGSCRACIDACPGQALSETQLHPWRCKSYITQKKEPLTAKEEAILRRTPLLFGCDECQRICPWNRQAAPSPLREIKEQRIPSLSAEELRSLSSRAFLKKYGAYAFAWRGKTILTRNLAVLEENKEP